MMPADQARAAAIRHGGGLTAPPLPGLSRATTSGNRSTALYAGLETVMRSGPLGAFRSAVRRARACGGPGLRPRYGPEGLGRHALGCDGPELQARLLKAFRRFTVATYVANFDKYDGERFQVLPGSRASGADRIVKTEIVSGNGDHIRLDYLMRDGGGTWRIVNVLLDGSISRVAVQRSDFRKILAGGDADALIASLHRKVADLSEGALSS